MRDDINVVYTQNLKDKMSEGSLKKSMSIENVVENIEVNQSVINRTKTDDIEIAKKLSKSYLLNVQIIMIHGWKLDLPP